MLTCLRGDGSYALDYGSGWERIMELSEDAAILLLGNHTITNKDLYVIPTQQGDYDYKYAHWDKEGREKNSFNKKYYPRALAVYKHDFTWWLIRRVS